MHSRVISVSSLILVAICCLGGQWAHLSAQTILFTEDFESYPSGSAIVSRNGWVQKTGIGAIPIRDGGNALSGKVADGFVDAGLPKDLGGGQQAALRPLSLTNFATYTLSFDAFANGSARASSRHSHNAGMGFGNTDTTTLMSWYTYNVLDGSDPHWSFHVLNEPTQVFRDIPVDQKVRFSVTFDRVAGTAFGSATFDHPGGERTVFTDVFDVSTNLLAAGDVRLLDGMNTIGMYQDLRRPPNYSGIQFDNIVVHHGTSAAEIEVTGNGIPLLQGDSTPDPADGTYFGTVDAATGNVTNAFLLRNTGADSLTIGTPRIVGPDASDFSVLALTTNSVPPFASGAVLALRFRPLGAGLRDATVVIPNNDLDEHPFTFAVQGVATGTAIPYIISPTQAVATLGQPFTYQIQATNGPVSYGAANLPPGLAVNTTNGLITGIPTQSGTNTVTMSASNEAGTGTRELTIEIAQPLEYVWATSLRATGFDGLHSVAVDDLGNTYVGGYFYGTVTKGTNTLDGGGRGKEGFIAKIRPDGTYVWARQLGNRGGSDDVRGISVDSQGDVYVTGSSTGVGQFGSLQLTNGNSPQIFIAKLNNDGEFLWVKGAPSTSISSVSGYGIAAASDGFVYACGHFEGTAVFGQISITARKAYDGFLAKLDADGNYLWAVPVAGLGSSDQHDFAYSVAVDSAGDVYVAGENGFSSGGFGRSNPYADKYDSDGNRIWHIGFSTSSTTHRAYGIAVDAAGYSYIAGDIKTVTRFGDTVLTNRGTDAFVAKIDPAGRFLWATNTTGAGYGDARSVAVNRRGEVFIAGQIQGDEIFGAAPLTQSGGYVAKLSSTGQFLWTKWAGRDYVDAVATTAENVFVAGQVNGDGNVLDGISLPGVSFRDGFVAKLGVPEPDIAIRFQGVPIANGDQTPESVDGTHFGSIDVAAGSLTNHFVVTNAGRGLLALGVPTVTGPAAMDFEVVPVTLGTVAPSDTTTFSIVFNPTDIGNRTATFSVGNNSPDEDPFTFALQGTGTAQPLAFTAQPADQVVPLGADTSFSVSVSGGGSIPAYQWYRNGTPLTGASNATLSINNVQPIHVGAYHVRVSAISGSTNSTVAALAIAEPPGILGSPDRIAAEMGSEHLLSVAPTGTGPFSYQWLLNLQAIAGATNSSYRITNSDSALAGRYSIVITGLGGTTTNLVAWLNLSELKTYSGITIAGFPGTRHRIDYADVIVAGQTNWQEMTTITITNNPEIVFDLGSPGRPKRFYRVVPLP